MMLTVSDVCQLAEQHQLRADVQRNARTNQPQSMIVWFKGECVEAWETLMSNPIEVPVSVYGTRRVTGSGATDGLLFPCYQERLDVVNQARASLGLDRVFP